jgi:hypothetical protein
MSEDFEQESDKDQEMKEIAAAQSRTSLVVLVDGARQG